MVQGDPMCLDIGALQQELAHQAQGHALPNCLVWFPCLPAGQPADLWFESGIVLCL